MTASASGTRPRPFPRERLPEPGNAWGWFGVASVTVMPVALALEVPFLPKRPLHIVPFDALIWLTALLMMLELIPRPGRGRRIASVIAAGLRSAWPGVLLLLVGGASWIASGAPGGGQLRLVAKTAFQWTEYLVLTPLVLGPRLASRAWRDRALWGLTAGVGAAVIAIAFRTPLESLGAGGEAVPHEVGGLLGNRNTYGMAMAMALPLLAGWGLDRLRRMGRGGGGVRSEPFSIWPLIPGILLPALAVYPLLHGGLLFAVGAGLAMVLLHHRFGGVLLAGLLAGWFVYSGLPTAGEASGTNRLRARAVQPWIAWRDEETGWTRSRPTLRYMRWAASLNSLVAHPALGVGWGGYQDALDARYGDIPRPEGRTDDPRLYDVEANEPLSFSWFLVTGVELGTAGLVAVLFLLGEVLLRAAGLGGGQGRPPVAAGLLGAALALLLAGLWAHPLTRGAGPLAGLLLAMSGVGGAATTKEAA